MTMERHLELQPGQILCLEHGHQYLYVELIQLINNAPQDSPDGDVPKEPLRDGAKHAPDGDRNLCWVRPLLLVDKSCEPAIIGDLRHASDLIWQLNSFRVALDTEVITYFHQVLIKEPEPDSEPVAKQKLNRFVQQLWQSQQRNEQ